MRASLTVALLAGGLAAAPAAAQQRQADLHADYSRLTQSKSNAWGAGAALQLTWGGQQALQPGGGGSVTPYAGGSASANWSGGDQSQWSGAKLGLETLAGLQAELGGSLSGKVEERYGYVRGQEHALTTRVGVLLSF
jgi:hypothetical protein